MSLLNRISTAIGVLTGKAVNVNAPFKQGDDFRIVSGIRQTPPKRGTRQILEAYSTMPWLRATTNKIARSVGETNWRLFAVRNGRGKAIKDPRFIHRDFQSRSKLIKELHINGELEEIHEHPLIDVLYGGNDFLSGALNFQVLQLHIDLAGEGYMLKQRDNLGIVIALWPIPPHWIQQIPTPDDFSFTIQWEDFYAKIPSTEMIWLSDPDPAKPYERGSSGAGTLADELETDENAAKHTKAFFYNSARPDIIVSGENLSPEDTKRLEQSWLDKHQGFWKSFKPFFISKSIQIKELSQTFQSMQLIDLRKFERDTIHQFFGIPPEILGITDTSNRATIDAADFIYSKNVIAPRVEVIRIALQKSLISDFDDRIILDYENPIAEDLAKKLEVYKAAPHAFTANEWRTLAGDEEKQNGNVFFLPFNFEVVEADSNIVSPPVALDDVSNDPEKMKAKRLPDAKQRVAVAKQEHPEESDLSVEQVATIESVVVAISVNAMNDRLEPVVTNTVLAFGQSQSDLLGTAWFEDDPTINLYIRDRIGNEITGVTVTTKEQIRKTLGQGMLAGESVRDLEARIIDSFKKNRRVRSRRIARTESVAAANQGSIDGMIQAGSEKKMWISSRDAVVRESHRVGTGLDGQIVGVRENFTSPISGATGQAPGQMSTAAESVNCRCAVISPNVRRNGMSETQKTIYWKSFESDRRPFEKQMLNASRDAFTIQENEALKALRSESQ